MIRSSRCPGFSWVSLRGDPSAERAANNAGSGPDDQAPTVFTRLVERGKMLKKRQFAHFEMNVIRTCMPGSCRLTARIAGLIITQATRPAGWEKTER
jgi:hypothetical protein